MKVEQVMTRDVVTVAPETPLKDVARILAERGISGVPVVDAAGTTVGVVSEADIIAKERGLDEPKRALWRRFELRDRLLKLEARTAGEAMTSPARTILRTRPVAEAAARMLDEGVNRLPVVDRAGTLVGIVTRADLVRAFVRPDEEIEKEIREDVFRRTLWLDPDAFVIHVRDGEVALRGAVSTRVDAELASAFVAKVPGVVEVDSSLTWSGDDLE